MGRKEAKQKQANPEQPGGTAPVIMNCKNETDESNGCKKISQYFSSWVQKLFEPPNIIALFLFFATLALYCATRDLVNNADTTANRQLRAYVGAKPIKGGVSNFGSDMIAQTEIEFHNFGKTPALELKTISILFPRVYPLARDTDLNIPPPKEGVEGITLHPNETNFGITLKRKVEPVQFIAIKGGISRMYAFGTISYKDVFGFPHWTHFCFNFDGEGSSLSSWETCTRYNDTDKN